MYGILWIPVFPANLASQKSGVQARVTLMVDLLSRLNSKSLGLVRDIGLLAQAQGMKAYLVGGPVRDLALKMDNVDLDITVEGRGIKLAERFAAGHSGAQVTGYPAFGTATVHLADGRLIDFATARKESYSRGGALPKVQASDIQDDLFRRDFTVNAMAISLNPDTWGQWVDPFGGQKDLAAKRLRILHEKSFVDDPTRILRLARFKARLGFQLEAATLKALKAAVRMKVLDTIKPQRYLKDFRKIEKEACAEKAMRWLKAWDALKLDSRQKHSGMTC